MKKPLLQSENRVYRTYRGGKMLETMLGKDEPKNSFQPEDWISSFVEAKNKNFIPGEGISRVVVDGVSTPITEVITADDLGPGRKESGVLIKFLDAAERLGIQVHPTPAFSRRYFGTGYGKTECWHILETADDAAVYIGFKQGITREKWRVLYEAQDIAGMLNALHRFAVRKGDTVLVRAGTPHAIGAGCFLLEIQEPTDYTMRVEKVTVAGETLTPMQIHYGVGEEAMLDCFLYEGLDEDAARTRYFLPERPLDDLARTALVTYEDTPCFALERTEAENAPFTPDAAVTLVITQEGTVSVGEHRLPVKRGDKLFVPYGCGAIAIERGTALVCYPPRLG